MDARQKFLIASIVLFVTSLPWKLIWMVVNPIGLIILAGASVAPNSASFKTEIACILIGAPALFTSWGTAAAGKGRLALIFGSVAVATALLLIVTADAGPNAARLASRELVGYLLWLGSPVAACLAGLACIARASNRR